MKSVISLLLDDFCIPYEGPSEYTNFYYIPNFTHRKIIIDSDKNNKFDVYFYKNEKSLASYSILGLNERETLEYIILYLVQNHTVLREKVPYTALNWNDPEVLITELIERGSERDETPDMIANKILECGLIYNVHELVRKAVEEMNYDNKQDCRREVEQDSRRKLRPHRRTV